MRQPEGRPKGKLAQNEQVCDEQVTSTAEIIAARLGLSQATVRRHAEFAETIDLRFLM
jgi:predicted ArsR family transcriptional regulator